VDGPVGPDADWALFLFPKSNPTPGSALSHWPSASSMLDGFRKTYVVATITSENTVLLVNLGSRPSHSRTVE
jgi:hypothetical protein